MGPSSWRENDNRIVECNDIVLGFFLGPDFDPDGRGHSGTLRCMSMRKLPTPDDERISLRSVSMHSAGAPSAKTFPLLSARHLSQRAVTASKLWLTNITVRPSLAISPILPRHFF